MNDTTRIDPQPAHAPAPQYGGPWAPPPAPAPARRTRGRGLAAGVVAASLVLGGAAGVGGAAAWTAWQDDEPATTSTTTSSVDGDSGGSDAPVRTDGSVESVAAKVLPSVVAIEVSGQTGAGSGSGVIISKDGEILTNNHVVELAEGGGQVRVNLPDGTTADAEIVGTDPLTDTAVIKARDVSGLTAATIGSSDDLAVGQDVVAVGSPFGLDATVTSGIVSALERPVDVGSDGQGNVTAYPAIQTDAAINPGNSGGPLVDMNGAVVGINASIRSTGGSVTGQAGSIGLGFAIPIDEVMPIVEQIRDGEQPTHARLGISVSDVTGEAAASGALVREIGEGTAADEAGLRTGDVITRIDDHRITAADSLIAAVRSYRPGDQVEVTFLRGDKEHTTDLELGSDAEGA
jgi:putative serine protease PepD